MRYRLASVMSRACAPGEKSAMAVVVVLKSLFLSDQDRVGTSLDSNFAFSSKVKDVESVCSWTLTKRVRLKIKSGLLLAAALTQCPSKESLERSDQLYQTMLRLEKNTPRGPLGARSKSTSSIVSEHTSAGVSTFTGVSTRHVAAFPFPVRK